MAEIQSPPLGLVENMSYVQCLTVKQLLNCSARDGKKGRTGRVGFGPPADRIAALCDRIKISVFRIDLSGIGKVDKARICGYAKYKIPGKWHG